MKTRPLLAISTTAMLALALASCGQRADQEPAATTENDAADLTAKSAMLQRTPSPSGASVFFISPADGDTVNNPVVVKFGLQGMTVAKAGDNQPNSGHHHLLIDTGLPDLSLPIPADASHVHFGDGSTVTEITLPPGEHTLQMLLGDHLHIPHDPPLVSAPVTITVE